MLGIHEKECTSSRKEIPESPAVDFLTGIGECGYIPMPRNAKVMVHDLDKSYGCRYGLHLTTEVVGISPDFFLTRVELLAGAFPQRIYCIYCFSFLYFRLLN